MDPRCGGCRGRATYKVKNDAREPCVDGEAKASLHDLQPHEAKRLQDALLEATEGLGRVVANRHVVLPLRFACGRIEKRKHRPVVENQGEVVVRVQVSQERGRHPRGELPDGNVRAMSAGSSDKNEVMFWLSC